MKDNKGTVIINVFQKKLDMSGQKPNKMWVDKGSEFYNRSMKSWLQHNDIEIYRAHNKGKSAAVQSLLERCRIKSITIYI